MALSISVGLLLVAAWVIYRPSALELFFPKCIFFQITGLLCPGCGGTRALHSLTEGHLLEALHHNPFTTILLPVMIYLAVRTIYRVGLGKPATNRATLLPAWLVVSVAAFLVLFMILRNIPLEIFSFLRPVG